MTRAAALLLCLAAAGCSGGAGSPLAVEPGTPCSQCRMTVLEPKLASQLLAPGEEPRFFDDLGCLAAYLSAHPAEAGATKYVADHATGQWIEASRAVYGRHEALATPMNSHLFAHATAAARAADAGVKGARALTFAEVFGVTAPVEAHRDR
ncbi:MAG TPA: nitrous oxide reductase accessory protein NosL [Vicinamibacterales bacterium]|nr:nitrous oxide reductase accessory protein NosL [Vicinamibacterales bacterium]